MSSIGKLSISNLEGGPVAAAETVQAWPRSPSDPPPGVVQKPKSPSRPPSNMTPDDLPPKDAPREIFEEELEEIKEPAKTAATPQDRLDKLIRQYYSLNPYSYSSTVNHELEVKFGTKGIKSLLRNDYDNVIKKLKSSGFEVVNGNSNGDYYLRVNCEFLDSTTGRFKLSDIRTEIKGLHAIQ